jgi:ectoine hydroxylase-related dioxygenase (phytanoyl-CoA dioxygenase family)
VYEQLWQRTDLVMTTDRVSFNPPETKSWRFPGPDLHWDVELIAPVSFATQGLVYLTDTTEQQGAFCCVPGFHLKIDHWINSQNKGPIELQQQNWADWPVKAIAAKAGDLIIWHQALPHGASRNTAEWPRMVHYINMYPLVD